MICVSTSWGLRSDNSCRTSLSRVVNHKDIGQLFYELKLAEYMVEKSPKATNSAFEEAYYTLKRKQYILYI